MSTQPQFWQTPTGILPDEDAYEIEQNFGTAPEEHKPYLAAKLNEYKVFRAHFPKPLNEYEQELRATDFRTLHGLATDYDGTLAKLPEDKREALAFANEPDPTPYRQRTWNQAFLDHVTGEASTGPEDYEARRKAFADANFEGLGGDDDATFNARATAHIKQQYDENLLVGELGAAAAKAAMAGKPYQQALAGWQKSAMANPAYKADRSAAYAQAGEEAYNENLQRTASYNDVVSEVLQVMGARQEQEGGRPTDLDASEVSQLAEKFVSAGYTREQRDWILTAAAVRAEEMGVDSKSFYKQFGEAMVRGTEIGTLGAATQLGRVVMEVGRNTANRMGQELREAGIGQPGYFENVGAKLEGQIAALDMAAALRSWGDQELDPLKPHLKGWMGRVESGVYGFGNTLPSLLTGNAAGLMMQALGMSNDTYMELREKYPNMTEGQAQAVALPAGSIMGALDRTERMLAMGGVNKGALGKWFKDFVFNKYARSIGVAAGAEFVTETAQNFVPLAIQELESKFIDDMPDPEFWKEAEILLAQSPETFIAIFPLAMLAGGTGVYADKRAARALLSSEDGMKLAGISPENITLIKGLSDEGKVDQAIDTLRGAWQSRDTSQSMAESVAGVAQQYREQAATQARAAAGVGVTVHKVNEGWALRDGDGNETVYSDWAPAHEAMLKIASESAVRMDEPILEALAGFAEFAVTGEQFSLTGQRRTAAVEYVEAMATSNTRLAAAVEKRVEIAKAALGPRGEKLTADDFYIHGTNETLVDVKTGMVTYASRLMSGGQVIDLIEEKAEGDVRRWIWENKTSITRLAQLIQEVEAFTGQTYLHGFDPADPATDGSQMAVIEAYSQIARQYATGVTAGGEARTQSRVTRALGSSLSAEQKQKMARLRQAESRGIGGRILKSARDTWDFFKGVIDAAMQTTAAIDENASFDEIRSLLQKSIGLTPEAQVARDVDQVVSEQAKEGAGSIPIPDPPASPPPGADPNLPNLTNVHIMPDGTWIAGPTTMSLGVDPDHQKTLDNLDAYAQEQKIPEKLIRPLKVATKSAILKARKAALPAWQQLMQGGVAGTNEIRHKLDKGETVSSIMAQFVSGERPQFNVAGAVIETPADIHQLMLATRSPYFESMKVVVVDEDGMVIGGEITSVGGLQEASADHRVVGQALQRITKGHTGSKVAGFIVSHNHPSGDPSPSDADMMVTKTLARAGAALGYPMLDHVVTNGEKYFSFKEAGMMPMESSITTFGPPPVTGSAPYKGSKFKPMGQILADWEVVPRAGKVQTLARPDLAAPVVNTLRTADPDQAHMIIVDTRLRVTAVARIDLNQGPEHVRSEVARNMTNEGGHAYFLSLPKWAQPIANGTFDMLQAWAQASTHRVHDVFVQGASGETKSGRQEWMTSFSLHLRHGSGADVSKFSTDFIGEGNGNAVYGWGIYFAEEPEVAQDYQRSVSKTTGLITVDGVTMTGREALDLWPGPKARLVDAWNNWARESLASSTGTPAQREAKARRFANEKVVWQLVQQAQVMGLQGWDFHEGFAYAVEVDADEDELLDWDRPISAQSSVIKDAIHRLSDQEGLSPVDFNVTGGGLYHDLQLIFGSPKEASLALLRAGIKGSMHQVPALARVRRDGSPVGRVPRNYVVFDDSLISITRKQEGAVSWSLATADSFQLEPLEEQPIEQFGNVVIHPATTFAIYWHGSGAVFDDFLMRYINTGEGAQAYGWGLYFAEKLGIARTYRRNLAVNAGLVLVDGEMMKIDEAWAYFGKLENPEADVNVNASWISNYRSEREAIDKRGGASYVYNVRSLNMQHIRMLEAKKPKGVEMEPYKGSLYKVDIPFDPEDLLSWDFPIDSHDEELQAKMRLFLGNLPRETLSDLVDSIPWLDDISDDKGNADPSVINGIMDKRWSEIHAHLEVFWDPREISEMLLSVGIPGIAYLDADSRWALDAPDPKSVRRLHKDKDKKQFSEYRRYIQEAETLINYFEMLRKGDIAGVRSYLNAEAAKYGWTHVPERGVYVRNTPIEPEPDGASGRVGATWQDLNERPDGLAILDSRETGYDLNPDAPSVMISEARYRFSNQWSLDRQAFSPTFRQLDNAILTQRHHITAWTDAMARELARVKPATRNVVIFDEELVKTIKRQTHGLPDKSYSLKAIDEEITDVMYQQKTGNMHTGNFEGGKVRQIAHKFRRMLEGVMPVPLHTPAAKADIERHVEEASERILTVIERAREAFPDFVSWYDKRLQMAVKIAQGIDPNLKQQDDLFIFKSALAVTSNGNAVQAQTEYAYDAYLHWKQTGKIGTYKGAMGKRSSEIRNHLRYVDLLIERIGIKAAKGFMDQQGTVTEVRSRLVALGFTKKQAEDMTNGELVDEVVPYAFIFGPKLGSFYNNLNGSFDTITMDRWFARTILRLMGTQLTPVAKGKLRQHKSRLVGAWAIAKQQHPKHPWVKELRIHKTDYDAMAKAINKWSGSDANRATIKDDEVLTELRLAGNAWYKVGDGFELRDAPKSGWERRLIRMASLRAIDKFNKTNKNKFTPAEFQAVLWYWEKAVHESHGSRQKEDSPDYAAGANALHRKLKGKDHPAFEASEAMMPPYARTGWNPSKAKPAASTARGNTTFSLAVEEGPIRFRAVQKGYLSETSDEIGPVAEYWQINLPGTYFHGSDIMMPVGSTQEEAMTRMIEKYAAVPEAQASLTPEILEQIKTFAMSTAEYIDRIADRFLNPQLAPAERVRMFAEVRDRLQGLARSIRHNESLDVAITMDGLRKQASIRRRQQLAGWRSTGLSYREAQQQAKEAADDWFAQQVASIPARAKEQGQEAVYRAMLTLEQMLAPFPVSVRRRVGGMIGIAQAKTQKARMRFLEERADRAVREVEEYLRSEYRQELLDLFDRARPRGGSGDKRAGKAGAYVHRWMDRAEDYALMKLDEVDIQVARWEKVIADAQAGNVPDDVMDELNSRWGADVVVDMSSVIDHANEELNLANLLGGTLLRESEITASDLATAFETANDVYTNGRLDWLAELARRREAAQDDRDLQLLPALGGVADPGEVAEGRQLTPGNRTEATLRDQFSFEQTVGDIFADENVRDWADTWERQAALAENEGLEERTAELRQALSQILATESITELNRRLAALAIPEDLNLPKLKRASQLELASLVMRYGEEGGPEWLEDHGYGAAWQQQAQAKLRPETRALMDWMARQYEVQYNRINAVYSREKGVDLPKVTGYAGARTSERGSENQALSVDGNVMEGGLSSGFTKTRVRKPAGPPKVENILQQYIRSYTQVEHYRAWARPMREMRQRLGHRDVMMTIEARKGVRARAAVNQWLQIFEQGGVRQADAQSAIGAWLRRMLTAQSEAALAFNLGTRMKQIPAAMQALADIRFGQFLRSGARVMTGRSAINPLQMLQSSAMEGRRDDYRNALLRMQVMLGRNARTKAWNNAVRTAFGWAFDNLAAFDAAFTSFGASVGYDAAYLEAAGRPEAERRRYAEARAAQVVSRTAQPNRPGTKSLWENQANVYARLLFRFQSANRQVLANEAYAIKHFRKDPERALRILVLAHFVIPSMVQVVANLLKHVMSDKEPEDIWEIEDFLLAWAMGPLSGLILFGPGIEMVLQKITGGGFQPRMATMPLYDILNRAMREWQDSTTSDEDFRIAAQLAGLAIGGDASILNAMDQIWRQALGVKKALDSTGENSPK